MENPKIKLLSVKHYEGEIRGNYYLMNLSKAEVKKIEALKKKYKIKSTRGLISKLIEQAE